MCDGCKGNVAEPLLLRGKCVSCWAESAEHYRRAWLDEVADEG